jgi:hypothetical protein
VDCKIFHGDRAALECADLVRQLAETYSVAEVAFDPWRFEAPALELAERGIPGRGLPASRTAGWWPPASG